MDCILWATCPINSPPLRAWTVARLARSLASRVLSALLRVLAAICSMLAAVWISDADCCSVLTESWALRADNCSDKVIAVCDDALISRTSVAILLDKLLMPGINRPAQLLPNSGMETERLPDVTSSILFFTVLMGVTRYFVIYVQSNKTARTLTILTAIKSVVLFDKTKTNPSIIKSTTIKK
ncbi:hypothetical protein D3C78_843410 [compost metagenome]